MRAVCTSASTANAGADGVLREVPLGSTADIADAGLMDAAGCCWRRSCLGINSTHGSILWDASCALCTCLAAVS